MKSLALVLVSACGYIPCVEVEEGIYNITYNQISGKCSSDFSEQMYSNKEWTSSLSSLLRTATKEKECSTLYLTDSLCSRDIQEVCYFSDSTQEIWFCSYSFEPTSEGYYLPGSANCSMIRQIVKEDTAINLCEVEYFIAFSRD